MVCEVLVVGEAVVDLVRGGDGSTEEHPGGSAVNVAVALARLGRDVALATSFADDAHGRLVAAHLKDAGVQLATDPHAVDRTSTAAASLAEDGSASYEFDLAWRLNPVAATRPVPMLHVCSLGAVLAPGATAVLELASRLRSEAMVSYDLNARPEATGTGPAVVAAVERMVSVSDLVKASDEDLAALYPDRDLEDAARHLLSLGPSAVAVTLGDQGASWFGTAGRVDVGADPVAVVDTIGAGDTFAAAMLDGLLACGVSARDRAGLGGLGKEQVERLLGHAVRAAAVTVSRPGADPPYAAELA